MFTVYMLSLSLPDSKLMLFVMLVLGAVSLLRCYQAASSPADGPHRHYQVFMHWRRGGRRGEGGVGGKSWAAILNSIVSFWGQPVGPAWTLSNVLSSLVAMGCLMSIKWCFVHWFMKVSKRQFLAREGLASLGLVITVRDWYLDTRYGTPWFVGKFNQFRSVQKNLQKIIIVIYILHLTEDDY